MTAGAAARADDRAAAEAVRTARTARRWEDTLALHALACLAATSAAGLLLALLLVVPEAGTVLGPLTYGRWAAVHIDIGLYGWCGLPLAGLLLRLYCGADDPSWGPRAAIEAWSGSVAAGALAWLLGQSSGKVFLEWSGVARGLFLASLVFLAAVLGAGLLRERRAAGRWPRAKALLLAALLAVPPALALATSRRTYPPINPHSGGPTGADLLGSSLAVLAVFVLAPAILGLELARHRRGTRGALLLLGAQALLFFAVSRGDASHRDPLQVAALATLLAWAVVLPRHLRRYDWPAAARPWLGAFLLWGAALLATGVGAFLPGVLERVKFTNALVGHAHIAMAGLASSFGGLVLVMLARDGHGPAARVLAAKAPFWAWHAGLTLHVAAVSAAGALEAADPGVLFRPDPAVTLLYAARALAGLAMLAGAATFLRRLSAEVP